MNEENKEHQIPARRYIEVGSRAQAMDWALVLASQAIPVWLNPVPEEDGVQLEESWRLAVEAQDQERAENAIEMYESENPESVTPGWGVWGEKMVQTDGLGFWFRGTSSIFWVANLAIFYWLQRNSEVGVEAAGKLDSVKVLEKGEWLRLLTAPFLHADLEHLASNAGLGFVWMGLVMARFGDAWALFGVWLAGAAGNLCGLFLYPDSYTGLGASGSVFGALGMLTGQALLGFGPAFLKKASLYDGGGQLVEKRTSGLLSRMKSLNTRMAIVSLGGGIMIFSLFGMSPDSDWIAHLGGFVFGTIWGVLGGFRKGYNNISEAEVVTGWLMWLTMMVLVWQLSLANY